MVGDDLALKFGWNGAQSGPFVYKYDRNRQKIALIMEHSVFVGDNVKSWRMSSDHSVGLWSHSWFSKRCYNLQKIWLIIKHSVLAKVMVVVVRRKSGSQKSKNQNMGAYASPRMICSQFTKSCVCLGPSHKPSSRRSRTKTESIPLPN